MADQNDNQKLIKVLQALADETRLGLVKKILSGPLSGSSCQMLSLGQCVSQPAISHHFKILVNSGVILAQKNGKAKSYKVNRELLTEMGIDLDKLTN